MPQHTPPDWAIEKALAPGLPAVSPGNLSSWTVQEIKRGGDELAYCAIVLAFASYIADHEQEPIDPLLVEARQIAREARLASVAAPSYGYAHDSVAEKIGAGKWDDHNLVLASLAALRRGIEIGTPA